MERLAELRESQALTLRDLAERSGVDANTINQVELGHRKPRPSTLRKLAKALDVEAADFFREPAVPLVEAPREAGPLNKDEILDVVHDAILEQEGRTKQAVSRTFASAGQEQRSYAQPENELMARLRETKQDVVEEALIETMRELVLRELAQQERERAQMGEEPTTPHKNTRTTNS